MADRVGQQLGNYHLIKLLGQGGFAEVYLGEHRYLKSHAALKVLRTALEDKQAKQFLAEAQTLVRLVHPNIVRVLDFTIEQGTPVLVMDYAPEGTLRDQHPAGTSLPLATVVSYVTQIATALQYAHNHNLIHRDVKPENMLLGPAHNLLLSDFGLALLTPSPELLSTQQMAGTIPYMAPEQLQGHPCFASDQYALGAVAYEWLCGSRPFAGSQWHLMHQHLFTAPPPLREKNPALSEAVAAVVLRALAKDPRDRYVSVQGFALALDRAHGETVPGDEEDSQITASLKAPSHSSFAMPLRDTPTDTQGPQGVFLAASSADRAVTARLKDDMEAQGIIVWNERLRNTPDALEQADGLRQEIRAASLILLLLSPHTRSSSRVTESIRIANLYERRMVFVWVADEEVAALLPLSQIWGTTAVIDVIDAREGSYERALAEIIAYLGEETTMTASLLPAFAESGDETQPLHTPSTPSIGPPPRATARVPTPLYTTPAPTRYEAVPQTGQTVSSTKDVNRKRLLAKVRAFWITGVLDHSLHGAALIALGLHEQPDAVTDPWHLVLTSPGEPAHALPPGTPIAQVYDDAIGELLILGQPGSGKTTLLLELARTLLDRASQDESHPMPVVFNLSSWAVERQPLTEWLVAELNSKYQVPRKLAQSWVDADQILPLLDGLDEVAPLYRAACVEAINIYRLSHGLVPTVVCSRSAEYLAQTVHVLLRNAVIVQPLTAQQIDEYLSSAGEQLESLRAALHADAALQELAATPLVLSVLTLAYHGKPVAELLAAPSPEAQRRQLFEAYVTRVLEHRGASKRYQREQVTHWLTYLAQQMKRQNQTVFYIEQMQPDWLPKEWRRYLDRALAGGVSGGLLGGLLGVAVGAMSVTPSLLSNLLYGASIGLVIGLNLGLMLGLFHLRSTDIRPAEVITWSWAKARVAAIASIVGGSLGLLIIFYSSQFIVDFVRHLFPYPSQRLSIVAIFALLIIYLLILILLTEICFILISLFARSNLEEDRFIVSRPRIWSAVRRGTLVAIYTVCIELALLILTTSIASSLLGNIAISTGIYLVALGCVSGLITGLIYGVSSAQLETRESFKPNQGIWRSLYNGGRISFLVGLIAWLAFDLPVIVKYRLAVDANPGAIFPSDQFLAGIVAALCIGVFFGLLNGGIACIKHLLLRIFLWQAKAMPWNCVRFFDYAAERILLRKVGGGYIFVHRLLLEHFASLATPVPEEAAVVPVIREPPPATSSTPQIDSTQREEKAATPLPNRKRGFNKEKRIAALLVIVLLLLDLIIGANIFAVVQPSLQKEIDAQATAAAQATAQVKANATAAAVANASPIAYPPQNISPVLNDPLQDNSKGNNWEVDDPGKGNCKFINRAYDINTNQYQQCSARSTDFTNFIYEIQMKIVKGYGEGIAFRTDPSTASNYSNYYYFVINQDGSYRVDASTNTSDTMLAQGSSSAIHRGLNQTNLLAAVVHGTIIELYVNLTRVAVVGSSTYTHGAIGVIVSGSSNNQNEVIFQNAKVWNL